MSRDYPMLSSHFMVQWGGNRIGFSEVSGLDMEVEPLAYREGNLPELGAKVMPGGIKTGRVTLKRGIVSGDNQLYEWINTIRFGTIERRDVVISLLDEEHAPVISWKLKNAWPAKYSGPDLHANKCEVAIESIELVHEGISILN